MNYLEWILAWDRWKQINQPPATVISLWHELMSVWNRCGWMDEFTVPNGLLQIGAGLSRKEFDNARGWLISRGRVYYTKSKRVNQAGRYRILPFPSLIVQNGQREGQRQGKQGGQREGQRTAHTGGTLFKLNETKLNEKEKTALEIAINDFKTFRQKIKAPMTDRAVELLITKLDKLAPGDDDAKIEILNQSIINGWKGIFALKDDKQAPKGKSKQDEFEEWANSDPSRNQEIS